VKILGEHFNLDSHYGCYSKLKKGKEIFVSLFFYARFLSINRTIIAPTIKIEAIMPATAGTKYASVIDCTGVAVGSCVG
jgi:hypothetical protein